VKTQTESRLSDASADDRSGKTPARAPQQRSRRWLLAVVAALLVAAAATYVVNQREDDLNGAAERAHTTGITHVEELLSYDYRDIERELAGEREWLTDDFLKSYTPLISDTFAPEAKKAKLITEATTVASGVESSSRGHVELLVFVNVAVQQGDSGNAQITGSRLRVDLDEVGGDWLISGIDPI
jgi:Mce-associated membrane protein